MSDKSETWADAQFDMLEAAYDEVPIWAKGRIAELTVERDAYFEMVKRVQADCDARDELIRDMLGNFEEQMHGPTIYPQTWYVAYKIWAQKLGIEVER